MAVPAALKDASAARLMALGRGLNSKQTHNCRDCHFMASDLTATP